MASGQTQYYGLSQWEAADKVERVDFNSDNARVDGALHTLAESSVPAFSMRYWISCAVISTPCLPGWISWRGSERAPRSKCSGGLLNCVNQNLTLISASDQW